MRFQGDNPVFREIKQSFPVTFSQYSSRPPFPLLPHLKRNTIMTNQQFSVDNFSSTSFSVFFFGLIVVAHISHSIVNNCFCWFMMIHYTAQEILCSFKWRNENRKSFIGRCGAPGVWFGAERSHSEPPSGENWIQNKHAGPQQWKQNNSHWTSSLAGFLTLSTHWPPYITTMTCLLIFPWPRRNVPTN